SPWPPGIIGGPLQHDTSNNLRPESLYGPNAGLTEILVPAGYVSTAYDPVHKLSEDGTKYVSAPSREPTPLAAPGLPFSLVFRSEPGTEDSLLRIASAYEAVSHRRVSPPDFGPLG
ncbi:MAG: amidase, partial [Alphaproteobacteria bacterium]|nr:amidase [Alphaproteobacteria bacterium]